jgi:hypothetical protein
MPENRNEIEALARELFAQAQRGDDSIQHPWMDETEKAESRAFRAKMLGSLGDIRALEFLDTKHVKQGEIPETEYSFRLTFETGKLDYKLGFFPDGKLNRFGLHPIPGELNPLEHYMPKRTG